MDNFKEIEVSLPTGYSVSAVIPAKLDERLVELALRAVLGGVVAVNQAYSEEVAREYLVRFVASILNEADSVAKYTQMNNRTQSSNSSRIIEEFLKTIPHKEDKKDDK